MAEPIEIPCPKLPKANPLEIPLPFGGKLQSLLDPSNGPPTDCALVHSLMLQLMPTLAGLTCLIKVLAVIQALEDTAKSGFVKTGDLLSKIGDLLECFNLLNPLALVQMIAAILRLIIAYLNCFIEMVESVLNFQLGIDLNSAQGNPVLLASLECARDNTETSLDQLRMALGAVQPLLDLMKPLFKIADVSFEMPALGSSGPGKDALQTVHEVKAEIQKIQEFVDSLPV